MKSHDPSYHGVWRRMLRSPACLLLHLSFLLAIAGGIATWLTAEKGAVRLVKGKPVSEFVSRDGETYPLPVELSLESFDIDWYPGGEIARGYTSRILAGGEPVEVSVNRIADVRGYRLCQSGYDSSGASVLSVNHDPWGIPLTYAGYVLFSVAGLWLLLSPKGRFRRLLRSLCVAALLCGAQGAAAAVAGIPAETADSLGRMSVVYQGRIVTFNTLSRDVLKKLYGQESYRGLSPEQTLISMRLYPDEWKSLPILRIDDNDLARALGVEGRYASLTDLFDSEGRYRVDSLIRLPSGVDSRAIAELDEKVGIVLTLHSGDLIVGAPAGEELSRWRVDAELLYNSIPFSRLSFIILFAASLLGFVSIGRIGFLWRITVALVWAALALSVVSAALEWVISRHIPLSNTFGTLRFAVIILTVAVLMMRRQGRLIRSVVLLLAGALALVAFLVEVNPVVTPLMPVLHSPWLSFHVSLVMTSYSLFALTFAAALVALLSKGSAPRLRVFSLSLLYPAEWLLGLGIITGSVWANESWGEYWSWDPKETWALVTFLIYALPLHPSVAFMRRPGAFHAYLLLALAAVGMTYFGVNLLDSLHAY